MEGGPPFDDLHEFHTPVPHDHSRAQSWTEAWLSLWCLLCCFLAWAVRRVALHFRRRLRRPQTSSKAIHNEQAERVHHTSIYGSDGIYDTAPAIRSQRLGSSNQQQPAPKPDNDAWLGQYNPYIQSEHALYRSSEFQQYIRQQGSGHFERVKSKLDIYRTLRKVDPSGFQKLWDEPNMQEADLHRLPALLALLEYIVPLAVTISLIWWALYNRYTCQTQQKHIYALAAVWAMLQARSMVKGHTSCIGGWLSVYAAKADVCYQASWMRSFMAHLLEVGYVCSTFGTGALVSAVCRCFGGGQQTFGEVCMGVFPVREVMRPVPFSKYAP